MRNRCQIRVPKSNSQVVTRRLLDRMCRGGCKAFRVFEMSDPSSGINTVLDVIWVVWYFKIRYEESVSDLLRPQESRLYALLMLDSAGSPQPDQDR